MSFQKLNYNLEIVKDRLTKQAIAIEALCQVDNQQAKWKPSESEWSILEVICHLYDEEREDFRARLAMLLSNPEQEWQPIAPEAWVKQRDYASQNHLEKIQLFLQERQNSIVWLGALTEPNWFNSKQHPEMGEMSAETMLFAWLAHDIRHIQQLSRLHYAYFQAHSHKGISYAG